MKINIEKQRDEEKVPAQKADKRSIATAVEYLIEECLRLDNLKWAKILDTALHDLKKEPFPDHWSKEKEQNAISIIRDILELSDEEKIKLYDLLNLLENKINMERH